MLCEVYAMWRAIYVRRQHSQQGNQRILRLRMFRFCSATAQVMSWNALQPHVLYVGRDSVTAQIMSCSALQPHVPCVGRHSATAQSCNASQPHVWSYVLCVGRDTWSEASAPPLISALLLGRPHTWCGRRSHEERRMRGGKKRKLLPERCHRDAH